MTPSFLSFFLPSFLFMTQQLLVGQDLLIIEASRTHTFGRTPLHEGSARRKDVYLTKHNTHKTPTSMSLAGEEPAMPADERPQTHALDRAGQH